MADSLMNFFNHNIISDWYKVLPLEFNDPTVPIIEGLIILCGLRLGYLVFIRKETSRYINTEMIYMIFPMLMLLFAVALKLVAFLVLAIVGFVLIWKVIKVAYIQIDQDEARGLYAYRQGIRKSQEEAFIRGETIQSDGLPNGSRPPLQPGSSHYQIDKRIFAIVFWVPSVTLFCILNYLLPNIRF